MEKNTKQRLLLEAMVISLERPHDLKKEVITMMLKRIRLLLEYGCYPVWLYDENGNIIDTLLPEELRDDTELDSKFDDLQARYNALFIDNSHEFSFVGFESESDREKFFSDWNAAVDDFMTKLHGRYHVTDEIGKSLK